MSESVRQLLVIFCLLPLSGYNIFNIMEWGDTNPEVPLHDFFMDNSPEEEPFIDRSIMESLEGYSYREVKDQATAIMNAAVYLLTMVCNLISLGNFLVQMKMYYFKWRRRWQKVSCSLSILEDFLFRKTISYIFSATMVPLKCSMYTFYVKQFK